MPDIQHFSYHTHTNFSDGRNSLEELIDRAKEIGLTELGISDHLIVHKDMKQSRSQESLQKYFAPYIYNDSFKKILPKFQKHCDEIHRLGRQKNMRLLVGFEVDFFTYDGWQEEFKEFISQLDYDYLLTGNHFLFDEKGEDLFNIDDLKKIYPDSSCYGDFIVRHFATLKQAVLSRMFNFLAHIDYIRRLGDDVCGQDMFVAQKTEVLKTLAATDTDIEVSTKGLRKDGYTYPYGWMLQEIANLGIKVVLSDDAHRLNELAYRFADAEKMLEQYKISRRLHI